METTLKSSRVQSSSHLKSIPLTQSSEFWQKIEFFRFGIIPIILLIVGCAGGLAAGFGAMENPYKIAIVAFPAVISLALMLAVSPMKLIVWSGVIAVILDMLVFFI